MNSRRAFIFVLCALLFTANVAYAHFGMVIPSRPTVMEHKDTAIALSLKFWHPFENIGMHLEKPAAFTVFANGAATDLLPGLSKVEERGFSTWKSDFTVKKPGLYAFVMEPSPYFEKEEDCYIVHLTKVYVDAFGDDDGWDQPLGLKAEIVPMARPGALYAGNVFQGRVLQNGTPVPGAEVEVEWYPGEKVQGVAPYESMVTQTVKADAAGIFTFSAPLPGWWGFAALLEDERTIAYNGEEKPVELGAVFWSFFHPLPSVAPVQ